MILNIYTDASTLIHDRSQSGIGVVVTFLGEVFKTVGIYIGTCSSTEAELIAILQGLTEASELCESMEVSKVRIISDCEPALDLAVGDKETHNEEIFGILEMIDTACMEIHCDVEFQWVKAHNNNKFNDLADKIAYDHAHN